MNLALCNSINFAWRVIPIGSPADQQGGIPAHQTQRETLEQVPCSLTLLLASVPGKGSCQHLDLPHCDPVEPSQSLQGKRDKGETLLATGFSSTLDFSVIGLLQGRSSIRCSPNHMTGGERAGHCHIKCSVFPIRPAGQEDIGWSSYSARQQVSALS